MNGAGASAGGLETSDGLRSRSCRREREAGRRSPNFGVFPGAGGAAMLPRKLPVNVRAG
ncbi:hypothetical protein ACU4GD_20490 [Cupriavidus basilensis]